MYQQQHCLRLRLLQHQQYSSIAASVQQHHYSMTALKHSATDSWFPLPFSLLLLCPWEFWCNPRILLIISFSAVVVLFIFNPQNPCEGKPQSIQYKHHSPCWCDIHTHTHSHKLLMTSTHLSCFVMFWKHTRSTC